MLDTKEVDINKQSEIIPGGFVISKNKIATIPDWEEVQFGEIYLYLTKYNKRKFISNNKNILILGDIYYSTEFSVSNILTYLNTQIEISKDRLIEAVKSISGRFIILIKYSNQYHIINDAGGLLQIFYSNFEFLAASHDVLISELSTHHYEMTYENLGVKWGYPGDISRFKNILLLTANHMLCMNNQVVTRFALNDKKYSIFETYNIVEEIVSHIRNTVESALKISPVYIGLTGGFDSRLTLASVIDSKDKITFITYNEGPSSREDIPIAKKIASKYSLNHVIINTAYKVTTGYKNESYQRFIKEYKYRNYTIHNPKFPFLYKAELAHDAILIRSNYYEVIKASHQARFLKKGIVPEQPENFAKFYTSLYDSSVDDRKIISDVYKEYFIRNKLSVACKYYDPFDIYYSEQTISSWLGQIMSGTDYAFTTCTPINSHNLIRKIYSVEAKKRMEKQLHFKAYKKFLPDILDIEFAKT